MKRFDFQNKSLPFLGLGAMRLPTTEDGSIDEQKTAEMVAYAIENGVNYFDTAYPYHNGQSEIVMGRILKSYPRESFFLATKYPGHQSAESYDPSVIFEHQLKKCGVDYFDFYLLHNVNENSIKTYKNEKWGIIDYFREQKKQGRIRHLGFSSHGNVENLREFLDYCGNDMEFCQIQLNYLDWTLQNAKAKCELLSERNIPVWVMEPVRGGKLVNLPKESEKMLKDLRNSETNAAWCFRFLQTVPEVSLVLSGMSNMDQLVENINTCSDPKPLTEKEFSALMSVAEVLKNSIPCTACGYCLEGCPVGINIPTMLEYYNELRISPSLLLSMRIEATPEDKRPNNCIGCNACASICPQNLDIPKHLSDFAEKLKEVPSWTEISRQRTEAAKKIRESEMNKDK